MKYDELLEALRGWPRVCVSYEGSIDELLDKAADAIEELQKENLRLHAFNDMSFEAREMLHERIKELTDTNARKWISVDERLPENDKTVLVWDRRNSREYFNVCDHGRWIILKQEDITHWMPLPEPPKEEKHDTDKRTT